MAGFTDLLLRGQPGAYNISLTTPDFPTVRLCNADCVSVALSASPETSWCGTSRMFETIATCGNLDCKWAVLIPYNMLWRSDVVREAICAIDQATVLEWLARQSLVNMVL